ncbi:MAG: methyltransferase family protein [Geminicoccaceae bacterium]
MFIRILLAVVVIALLVWGLFTTAGRWDWMQGWVYLAVIIGGGTVSDVILWWKNPELLRRRSRFGKGTKTWDKIILTVFGVTSVLMMFIGALDSGRYQWSVMSPWLWPVGAAFYIIGQFVLTWSMLANPFFEKTARIQTDRGHRVIDGGPYRYVRHPGYMGTILGLVLGSPLMLGSWWAFVPAIATVLGLIIRTVLEDRMLMQELAGYEAYAKRVRYRLVPYLW